MFSTAVIAFLLIVPPIAYGLAVLWEAEFAGDIRCQNRPPDVIVVLPGGVRDSSDRGLAGLTLDSILRLEGAMEAAERFGFPRIVVSGSSDEAKRISEAAIKRRGLRSEVTYLSDAGDTERSTHEVMKSGFANTASVWLVTSGLHMRRSVRSFEHYGISVCPYPVDMTEAWSGLIPDYRSIRRADALAHEFVGLVFYEMRFAFSDPAMAGS